MSLTQHAEAEGLVELVVVGAEDGLKVVASVKVGSQRIVVL